MKLLYYLFVLIMKYFKSACAYCFSLALPLPSKAANKLWHATRSVQFIMPHRLATHGRRQLSRTDRQASALHPTPPSLHSTWLRAKEVQAHALDSWRTHASVSQERATKHVSVSLSISLSHSLYMFVFIYVYGLRQQHGSIPRPIVLWFMPHFAKVNKWKWHSLF